MSFICSLFISGSAIVLSSWQNKHQVFLFPADDLPSQNLRERKICLSTAPLFIWVCVRQPRVNNYRPNATQVSDAVASTAQRSSPVCSGRVRHLIRILFFSLVQNGGWKGNRNSSMQCIVVCLYIWWLVCWRLQYNLGLGRVAAKQSWESNNLC